MSLFTSIASAVVGSAAKNLLGGSKKSAAPAVPKFRASTARYMRLGLKASPAEKAEYDGSGQITSLINRHEAIMNSLRVEEGAVSGKYGSLRI